MIPKLLRVSPRPERIYGAVPSCEPLARSTRRGRWLATTGAICRGAWAARKEAEEAPSTLKRRIDPEEHTRRICEAAASYGMVFPPTGWAVFLSAGSGE